LIKYVTIASCFITSATYVRLSFFKDFDLLGLDLDNKHFLIHGQTLASWPKISTQDAAESTPLRIPIQPNVELKTQPRH